MQTIRSLHVETGMNALGGPSQVVYLMSGLKERGHKAVLVCPEGSSVSNNAKAAGLNVITVPFRTDIDVTFIMKLYRIIKRSEPDIVHLHSRRGADIMGGIAARMAHVPAVILSRRIDNPVRRGPFSYLKYNLLSDRIISISDGVTNALLKGGVSASKITRVRSVVDAESYSVNPVGKLREELKIPAGTSLIGIVAQLIERKGHRYLFDAMPAVLDKFPDTMLLVLGHGQQLSALNTHVKNLGIEKNIIFAGFRNDMPLVLHELDMLVHPATMEGLGIAILQAMAASVPVVASAVGGIPESVHDGVNGILVPPRDVKSLSDAIIRLLSDPDLRHAMGKAGRRIVEEEFSIDSMIEGVLSVYRDALHLNESAL